MTIQVGDMLDAVIDAAMSRSGGGGRGACSAHHTW